MNEVFDINRFGRYLVTDIKNAVDRFGISVLVMSLIGLAAYMLVGSFSLLLGSGWYSLGEFGRIFIWILAFTIMVILGPAQMYGFITDKKEGTSFLMTPVSTLEKTLSMIIVCCLVMPLSYYLITMSIDSILCLVDKSCGKSILVLLGDVRQLMPEALREIYEETQEPLFMNPSLSMLSNPWLLVDDRIQSILIFLLGALCFKTAKPAKTIGCLLIFSMLVSLITTPIILFGMMDKMKMLTDMNPDSLSSEQVLDMFPTLSWAMQHLPTIDTVSDTVTNLLLCFFIWLRVKRIKH